MGSPKVSPGSDHRRPLNKVPDTNRDLCEDHHPTEVRVWQPILAVPLASADHPPAPVTSIEHLGKGEGGKEAERESGKEKKGKH